MTEQATPGTRCDSHSECSSPSLTAWVGCSTSSGMSSLSGMSASTQDCKASATSAGELLSGKTGPKGPPKGRSSEGSKAGAPPARGFLPHKPTPTGQHVLFLASQGYEPGVLYTSALIAQSSQGRLFTQGSATLGLLWEQGVLIHQWLSSRSSTRLCGAYWVPKPEMSWVAS